KKKAYACFAFALSQLRKQKISKTSCKISYLLIFFLNNMKQIIKHQWQRLSWKTILTSLLFISCLCCSVYNLVQNFDELLQFSYMISPTLLMPQHVTLPNVFVCINSFINATMLAD